MRWRTTLILAVLLAGVAVFYYVYEVRLGPGREKTQSQKDRVFTAEPKDVESITVRRKGDTLRLRREGDGWMIVEPVTAKADKGPAEDLVSGAVNAKAEREADPNPAKLADFGLDPPLAELTISVKGKAEPLSLLLGEKSPTRVWVYGKTKEKPAVFLTSDVLFRDATKKVEEFRDKTILAIDRKDVIALEVRGKGEALAAESGAPGEWKMTKPRSLPADRDRIADFVDKVQFSKVKEFVAESPKEEKAYGLDQPTEVTFWSGKEKGRTAKKLLFGKFDAAKKGVYAKRAGEPSVFLLPEEVFQLLPKSATDLREKSIVAFERDKVERIALESPKGRVILAKEGEKWMLVEPEKLKADDGEVNQLLSTAVNLKAQEFVAEDAASVGRLLGKPEARLSLTEKGATQPKVLLLTPAKEKRGASAMAYAAREGQGPVALVNASSLADLGKSVTDLRDRSLFGFFESSAVKKVQIKVSGKVITVERKGESDWQLIEPTKGRARAEKVSDILWTLRTVKWSEIVSPKGEDAARFGLDAPSSEVILFKADGSELGRVAVGRRDGDKVYLRTHTCPAIYSADSKALKEFPKSADDLQG